MAITGNQKALMYALGGVARGGATRGGYTSGHLFIQSGGVHIGRGRAPGAPGVILESFEITDTLDETPNRCRYREHGAVPETGTEIVCTLGSKNNLERMFAGNLLTIDQIYAADKPANVQAVVAAVDYTWLFAFHKATKRYQNMSASDIAANLIATYAAVNGFTSRYVAPGLPVVDELTFTNEGLDEAMTRLARRIGAYWYVDYHKHVHLFFSEVRNGAPVPLTPTHVSLAKFVSQVDRSQVLTRVYVEGRGAALLSAVLAGDTMIPIAAADMFAVAADVFLKVSPQGSEGGAQHLNFAGVDLGGRGSLVGPGAGPPGPASFVGVVGSGLSKGLYAYAYTFVTASGESLPSPGGGIDVGALIAAPPSPVAVAAEPYVGGVESPAHYWTYTYLSGGGGETTGAAGTLGSTQLPLTPTGGIAFGQKWLGGVLEAGKSYRYAVTYIGSDGGETTVAPAGWETTIDSFGNNKPELFFGDASSDRPWARLPAGAAQIKLYRTTAWPFGTVDLYAKPHYYVATITILGAGTPTAAATYMDVTPDAALGALIPTTNTALCKAGKVTITGITPGPAGTTARRIYRTRASDGSVRLVATIADNTTTTYIDTVPDASLGALMPSSNTAGDEYRRVQLSNISTGPTSAPAVTSRKIYRTAVGGGPLKLLATIADNTTTTYLDSTPDGSLGATAPAGDTSGISQPSGQVPGGSTSVIVANVGAFNAAGGWAVIGNGEQVIRYTGKSSAALTGVPAAGVGAIIAAVAYNSTITAAPMVTGIPATGTRAIVSALTEGDELYLVVQADDVARQAALAADLGTPDGIREEWIQDRRLSITEARARGRATLELNPLDDRAVSYTCRDLRTASGKTIDVSLGPPTNVSGSFKIQEVVISNFRPHGNQYPTFTVRAASRMFSFEDLLRRLKTTE